MVFYECISGNHSGIYTVATNVELDDEGGSLQYTIDGINPSDLSADSFIFSLKSIHTTNGGSTYTSPVQFTWNPYSKTLTVTWTTLSGTSSVTGDILCIVKGSAGALPTSGANKVIFCHGYLPYEKEDDAVYLLFTDDTYSCLQDKYQGNRLIMNNPDYEDYEWWYEQRALLGFPNQFDSKYMTYAELKDNDWQIDFNIIGIYDAYGYDYCGVLFEISTQYNFNLYVTFSCSSSTLEVSCSLIYSTIDLSNYIGDDIVIRKTSTGLTITADGDEETYLFTEPFDDETGSEDDCDAYLFSSQGDPCYGFVDHLGFKYIHNT